MHFPLMYHQIYTRWVFLSKGMPFLAFLLISITASSQKATDHKTESFSYTAADSEFVMVISRVKTEVVISITFKDSLVFDYVSIERQPDYSPIFTQCKYISYAEANEKGRHIVIHDAYPYAASIDVAYRVKLAYKDGAMRTYPPLLLPAVSK
jgi:hypothetical protein